MPTGRSRKRWLRKVLEGKKELERCWKISWGKEEFYLSEIWHHVVWWEHIPACCLPCVGFLLGLLSDPDRSGMFLRNICWLSPDYTSLHPRREYSSYSPMRELTRKKRLEIFCPLDYIKHGRLRGTGVNLQGIVTQRGPSEGQYYTRVQINIYFVSWNVHIKKCLWQKVGIINFICSYVLHIEILRELSRNSYWL
jgi:hypothetical protein